MKSVYNFVVTPIGERYNNKKKIGGEELILNSSISNHLYINKKAKVISKPIIGDTDIKPGDEVMLHHNVFRRWYNVDGVEKNSRSFFDENTYLVNEDQIFLHNKNGEWKPLNGYCFVQPIKNTDQFDIDSEQPLVGIVEYPDNNLNKGDLVGFTTNSEFEFIVDGRRLYRVLSNFITIKYEYQGNEKAYNPSWT